MFGKKGFTLVEILFVLIIMAVLVAFAVPAYKKAQERSRYEAALGTLQNVGNAVMSFKNDLSVRYGYTVNFPATSTTDFQIKTLAHINTLQVGCIETPSEFLQRLSDPNLVNQAFVQSLYELDYMRTFDESGESGYEFYVPGKKSTVCSQMCLGSDGEAVVACMCQTKAVADNSSPEFYGARMLSDGTIRRFIKPA